MFRWSPKPAPRPLVERMKSRLELEALEDRVVPTTGAQFNIATTNNQPDTTPSVDVAADEASDTSRGIVAWAQGTTNNGTDIRARVASAATPLISSDFSGAFTIAGTVDDEDQPSVAISGSNGNFVVSWRVTDTTTGNQDIWYALFDVGGNEIIRGIVSASETLNEFNPEVAMNFSGRFVITYVVKDQPTPTKRGPTIDLDTVNAHIYDSAGAFVGAFQVANNAKKNQDSSRQRVELTNEGRISILFHQSAANTTSLKESVSVKRYQLAKTGVSAKFLDTDRIVKAPRNGAILSSDVALDTRGATIVVYNRQSTRRGVTSQELFVRTITPGGQMGGKKSLQITGNTLAAVRIAATPRGNPQSQALVPKPKTTKGSFMMTVQIGSVIGLTGFFKTGKVTPAYDTGGGVPGLLAITPAGGGNRASIAIDALDCYFVAYQIPANNGDVVGRTGVNDFAAP